MFQRAVGSLWPRRTGAASGTTPPAGHAAAAFDQRRRHERDCTPSQPRTHCHTGGRWQAALVAESPPGVNCSTACLGRRPGRRRWHPNACAAPAPTRERWARDADSVSTREQVASLCASATTTPGEDVGPRPAASTTLALLTGTGLGRDASPFGSWAAQHARVRRPDSGHHHPAGTAQGLAGSASGPVRVGEGRASRAVWVLWPAPRLTATKRRARGRAKAEERNHGTGLEFNSQPGAAAVAGGLRLCLHAAMAEPVMIAHREHARKSCSPPRPPARLAGPDG